MVFKDNEAIVMNQKDFCEPHIFDCGQTFRFYPAEKGYIGIAGDRRANIYMQDGNLHIFPCDKDAFNFWRNYLDLDRDYEKIKDILSSDLYVKDSISCGNGMRILKQEPFETIISFIISANNNVKRIMGIIERICVAFGDKKEDVFGTYYAFPKVEQLLSASQQDLLNCGAGYRAPYIVNTVRQISEGFDINTLGSLEYLDAKKKIQSLQGVGPKVADCILLFAYGFGQAYPLDVWVKRVTRSIYLNDCSTPKEMSEFACAAFGEYAGIAQQYMFFNVRKNGLPATNELDIK